ncbi:hypothetical protein [Streptomyces coelicoflavus]|uniref:hypothetical protein n=1 Tax=Streptomyces coelicoflavus TaxID=285562 RepID=UPI0036672262
MTNHAAILPYRRSPRGGRLRWGPVQPAHAVSPHLAATAVLLATPNVAVAAGGTGPGDTEAERAVSGLLEAVDQLRTHPIAGAESVDGAQTAARMQDHRV